MYSGKIKKLPSIKNIVTSNITGGFDFNLLALCLFISLLLLSFQVVSAPIQRTITIDNDTSDWKTPTDITANPGQFSTDAEGDAATGSALDLDFEVQATGRDLERFSYTYDSNNLYLWVERYASTSNRTDWWFYLDINNDGKMQATDRLLQVAWTGSNGNTKVSLYHYVPASASTGGDPLVCSNDVVSPYKFSDGWCPVEGQADGYDMPGSQGTGNGITEITLDGNAFGDVSSQAGGNTTGTQAGVEMEVKISWGALGSTGPFSLGFHIASSNGTNIPTQINDNMNGVQGGAGSIAFSELAVTKSASVASVTAGSSFIYSVTVTNNGDSDATNVSLDDVLPAGVSYVTHLATAGTYDPVTGLWSIGPLADTLTATLDITVIADQVTADTVVTNTANNLQLDQIDLDSSNNQASAAVTVKAAPDFIHLKSAQIISDPFNGGTDPKAIPGAEALYTIQLVNQGFGTADAGSVTITDQIPANTELFTGDLDGVGTGPVIFVDGTPASGFSAIAVEFSTDGINYGYTPAVNYDALVTHIKVTPTGTFSASDGTDHPNMSILFKVRIQ